MDGLVDGWIDECKINETMNEKIVKTKSEAHEKDKSEEIRNDCIDPKINKKIVEKY